MWLKVFICCFPIVINCFFLDEQETKKSKELANLAIKIVENDCKICKTNLIIHTGRELSCEYFFKDFGNTVSVYTVLINENNTDAFNNNTEIIIPELTIIFLNLQVYSVEDVIFTVEVLTYWNIRGKFLLLIEDNIEEDELDDWLQETFESFWDRQALRVLVNVWNDDIIKSYTFDPFRKDYKIFVDKNNRNTLWFNRRVNNMFGVPIKLYQFDTILTQAAVKKILADGRETWVGPDGMFFSTLAESLNTTLKSHKLSQDFDETMIKEADPSIPFSQYFQLFSDMFDFDLLFNRMQTFSDNNLDHIFLYERNDWYVIVPKTGMVPQYLYVLLMVNGEVWAAILISLLSISLVRKMFGRKSTTALDNLNFILGNAAPHRKHMSSSEKCVVAIWSLSCMVLVTVFQTTFMSTLIVPKYYPNLDTLDELSDSDLVIYSPEYITIQLKRSLNHKVMDHVMNISRNITIYGENIEWINLFKNHYGIILSQEHLYRAEKVSPSLFETSHKMSESPMPNAMSYNMPRNKLYYDEVQRVFGIIQEAGLHIYWRSYDYNLERNITKTHKTTTETTNQILTLYHFQSCFFLLIFGLLLSLVTFCCELMFYRVITKKQIRFKCIHRLGMSRKDHNALTYSYFSDKVR